MAKNPIQTRLAPNAPWPVYEAPPPKKKGRQKKEPEPISADRESKYQLFKSKVAQTNKNFDAWLAKQQPVRKKNVKT